MFGSIGMPELMIIFVIALIIFGPRKLPELGRSMGKSLSEFKRASHDLKNTLDEEIRIEDSRPVPIGAPEAAGTGGETGAHARPEDAGTGRGTGAHARDELRGRETEPAVLCAPLSWE